MKKTVIGAVAAITAIAPTPLLAASWEVAHADTHTVVTTPPVPTAPQRAHEAPPVQHAPPAPPPHEPAAGGQTHPVQTPTKTPTPATGGPTHAQTPTKTPTPATAGPTHPGQTPTKTPPVATTAPTHTQTPTKTPPVATTAPTHTQTPTKTPTPAGGKGTGSGTSSGPTGSSPRVSTSGVAHGPIPLPTPTKGPTASKEAVDAARNARPKVIDPVRPPALPKEVNFNHELQDVITAMNNIDVMHVGNQVVALPSHWDYIDYDDYHRPILYNPINEALTFRYFYDGDYREAYVPMGGQIVLNISIVGTFAFTAVGQDYVTVGNFQGGGWIPPEGWVGPPPDSWTPPPPPQVWQDVTVAAVDTDTSMHVDTVTVVGHDDSRPAGQQDTLMLNDSTMAWGEVQDGRDGGAVQVANVQTLPGVGPVCDAGQWMNTAAESPTHQGGIARLKWVLGAGLAVTTLVGGGATWMIRRRIGAHA